MRLNVKYVLLFILLAISVQVRSEENLPSKEVTIQTEESWWTQLSNHLKTIWNDGGWDMMLPVYTWHCPWRYSREKVKEYNNIPWGIGVGKYIEPTPDRRYGLRILTFQDSFNKPEPSVWYSWQALWREGKDFRPSLGFVAGITCRENYHWIPIPGAAPTVGFDYKSFSVEALYVPGFDVVFTWLSWRF